MKTCKTCRHRDNSGICHCRYIKEDTISDSSIKKMLLYQHQTWPEDGRFLAGDDFGCIYHIEREETKNE